MSVGAQLFEVSKADRAATAPADDDALVVLDGVSKAYANGTAALGDVSFTMRRGAAR